MRGLFVWALALGVLPLSDARAQSQSDSGVFDAEGAALLEALVGQQLRDAASQIQTQNQMMSQQNKLVQRLNTQVVAEAKFEDASLKHVTDYVREMSKELDPNGQPINLIVTPAAAKEAEGKSVNLKLNNVPLSIVLKYAGQQLGLIYRVDQYVVVLDVPQRVGSPATNRTPVRPATPVQR